jgi:hypothetical protein
MRGRRSERGDLRLEIGWKKSKKGEKLKRILIKIAKKTSTKEK